MKFTILKKVFGSGAAAPKPKFAFLALLRDIEQFPSTDSLGVVLLGDVVMKKNCGMMQIYITPSSQEYGYETSGDSGSKGYKVKFNGTHPGTEKEALEFVTNYLEEEFVILIPDCNKGVRVLGSPEAPLVFTSTHKSAKDGQKFNFIFEQEVAVDFIYRLYDGIITLNDNIDIDMGDFLEALKNYIKIDGSNLSEMQKQNLRQILGLDTNEGNIGNKDLSLNENRNFNLKSFFLNFFNSTGTAKVGINKNNPQTALDVVGGITTDDINIKKDGKTLPIAVIDEGLNNETYNKDQIQAMVESDFKGIISPTDPAPTVAGSYKPQVPGTYTNLGGLVAKEGYDTLFYFNGTTWSKSEVAMPQATNEIEPYNPSLSYTAGKQLIYTHTDGSLDYYQVKAGETLAVGETPKMNEDKLQIIGANRDLIMGSRLYDDTIFHRYVNASQVFSNSSMYDSTDYISVKKGDKIKVWASTSTTLPVVLGLDTNNILTAALKTNLLIGSSNYNGVEIIIPEGVNFVVVSGRNSKYTPPITHLLKVEITESNFLTLDRKIDNIDIYSKTSKVDAIEEIFTGKVARSDTGVFTTVSSRPNQVNSGFIAVEEGDEVYISGLFSSSVGVAGFSDQSTWVSRISDSSSLSLFQATTPADFKITIPTGVKYIVVSSLDNSTNPLKVDVIKSLDKILEYLKEKEQIVNSPCYYKVDLTGYNGRKLVTVFSKLKGSSRKYVGYSIAHELNDDPIVNIDYYRIVTSKLYELVGRNMEAISSGDVWITGENEFTLNQLGKSDHSGGYHGDEIFELVNFYSNGNLIDTDINVSLTACDFFEYQIKSNIKETSNESTPTVPISGNPTIAKHFKRVKFSEEVTIINTVKFTQDIAIKRAYAGIVCQHKNFAATGNDGLGNYQDFTSSNNFLLQTKMNSTFKGRGVLGSCEIFSEVKNISKVNDYRIQNQSPYKDNQLMYVHDRNNDSKYYNALGFRSGNTTPLEVINVSIGEIWEFRCVYKIASI